MHDLPYPDLPDALVAVASAMPNLIEVDDLTFATLVAFLSSNPRVRLVPSVVMHEPGGRDRYNRATELHRHLKAVREFNQLLRASQPVVPTATPSSAPNACGKPKAAKHTRAARRGRPAEYDEKADAGIYRMWVDGDFEEFAEMEQSSGIPAKEIKAAVARHRKRLENGGGGKS